MVKGFLAVLLLGLVALSEGHSYMTVPRGRDDWKWNDCRLGGPSFSIKECHSITPYTEAGPCEKPYSPNQRHHNGARGGDLRVEWPRNNHPGGFVRLAWLPSSQTELPNAHQLFDGNVQLYTCFEKVCAATPGYNGGDNLGTDGGCWINTKIPSHLTDGDWTLQWTWYGGMYGSIGDYYTCANFKIQGGTPVGQQQQPVFIGGDASNPNNPNVCDYFTTNRLHYCVREPCENVCRDNTAPAGHCGWPAVKGAPFIDPLIQQGPVTTGPPPQPPPGPVTTGGGSQQPGPRIVVTITVKVETPPPLLDITTFVYSIAGILEIPVPAIEEVSVDLDQSTDTATFVVFKLINAVGSDGKPIDPLAQAVRLKEIADSNDPRLQSEYRVLNGLQVIDTKDETSTAALSVPCLIALFACFFALLM